jgi:hypothetical protein
MNVRRMTALDPAGPGHNAEIAGIEHHTGMRLLFIDRQGIAQMTGRTANHQPIMGPVQLLGSVAIQAHLHQSHRGNRELLGSFGGLFTKDEKTDQQDDER